MNAHTRSRRAARLSSAALLAASMLLGCSSSEELPSGPIPLADALPAMEPNAVWQHFYELTQVPRVSHHEEGATALVADFDMVWEATDPAALPTEPIDAFLDGGWVRADGTTLGADDGIGVAVIMALLESDHVAHGPLEALFTINEEDGLEGINALATAVLQGRLYVNVDNELEGQLDDFRAYLDRFGATVKTELQATDGGVTVTMAASDLPAVVMDAEDQAELIPAVYVAPQGVWAWADYPPGLVETSGNLGVLQIAAGQFTAGAKVRSAENAERDAHAQRYVDVFTEVARAASYLEGAYSAWPPNPDSPLLALMEKVYVDTFGTAPEVAAIHAGPETSVAGEKYPGMDMISVGATIQDLHTARERVDVASVAKVYELLVATLGAIE